MGFMDIAGILWRNQLPCTLLELAEEWAPTPVAGSTLFVSCMVQDAWGNLYADFVTYQLSIMGVGFTPALMVSEMPALEDALECG